MGVSGLNTLNPVNLGQYGLLQQVFVRDVYERKDIGASPASVGVLDTFNLSHLLYYFASLTCSHIDKDVGFH